MKLSKFSEKYINNSFNLYIKSLLILSVLPVVFFKLSGFFSGFGFYIINSNLILILQKIIIFSLIVGISIPTVIILLSLISGLNRKLIANFFPFLNYFTIFGLIAYLLIQVFSFSAVVFLFLNEIAGLKLIFVIIGISLSLSLVYVFPPIIKGVFKFSKVIYIPVIGVVLNNKDHSEIFSFIKKISKSINSKNPKNIVVSMSTSFYAISKDINVFNGVNKVLLKDETIHISLPFLRILTIKELEGIIGHELGHFEGEDTLYAIKFAPIYRRLNQQFLELEKFFEKDKDTKSLFIKLAVYPIILLFNEFTRKEEKISKIQELKADNFGAKTSGGSLTFINALSKVYIYGMIWSKTEDYFREMVREKNFNSIKNLSLKFTENAKILLDKKKLLQYLEGIQYYEQLHPSDTHPNLEQRMKNLNIDLNELSNEQLTTFTPSAALLIPKIHIIEQNLTLVLKELEK